MHLSRSNTKIVSQEHLLENSLVLVSKIYYASMCATDSVYAIDFDFSNGTALANLTDT